MSWLQEEDPEVLRAALEIIEAWDGVGSVTGDVHSLASTPGSPSDETDGVDSTNDDHDGESGDDVRSPAPVEKKTKKRTLPDLDVKPFVATRSTTARGESRELKLSTLTSTRHRRREEIIYLREKVMELEKQLEEVQETATADALQMGIKKDLDNALAVAWQDIAARQQRMRQKSELEQAKLKKLLETQVKVAQGLMKLMQAARRIEDHESYPLPKRPRVGQITPSGSRMGEQEHLAWVEKLYSQKDEAFSFSKFHDGTTKFIDIQVTDDGTDNIIVELRESWVMPFEASRVFDALWQFAVKKSNEKMCQPEHKVDAQIVLPDLVMSQFLATILVGESKCNLDGRMVLKRFREDTVESPGTIVTCMSGGPHQGIPGIFDGTASREDVWMRVVPLNDGIMRETTSGPLSQVQCTHRFNTTFDDCQEINSRQHAGTLTNLVLDKLKMDVDMKHETIEALLLGHVVYALPAPTINV